MVQQEVYSGQIVDSLRHSLRDGKHGLSLVPMLVKRIIQEDMWRDFVVERTKERVTYDRFIDFVTTKPLEGLGADLKLLRRICADHKDVLDLIDGEVKGEHGGDRGNQYTGGKGVIHPLATRVNHSKRDRSTKHLRRLCKDFPSLHKQVLDGNLTVTEAANKAGFYPKRASISFISAASAAETIIKAGGEGFARELIDELEARLREGGKK
jgi:hypothetical protein